MIESVIYTSCYKLLMNFEIYSHWTTTNVCRCKVFFIITCHVILSGLKPDSRIYVFLNAVLIVMQETVKGKKWSSLTLSELHD